MTADYQVGSEKAHLVILIIPSHRQNEVELEQSIREEWLERTQILFAELFVGSTAFDAISGSFWSEEQGKVLWDKPIVVESYAMLDNDAMNASFAVVSKFAQEMRTQLDQESVLLIVDNYPHFIERK